MHTTKNAHLSNRYIEFRQSKSEIFDWEGMLCLLFLVHSRNGAFGVSSKQPKLYGYNNARLPAIATHVTNL